MSNLYILPQLSTKALNEQLRNGSGTVTDDVLKLEQLRIDLLNRRATNRYTPDVQNAVHHIEQALLYLKHNFDHFNSFGIAWLDIDVDVNSTLQRVAKDLQDNPNLPICINVCEYTRTKRKPFATITFEEQIKFSAMVALYKYLPQVMKGLKIVINYNGYNTGDKEINVEFIVKTKLKGVQQHCDNFLLRSLPIITRTATEKKTHIQVVDIVTDEVIEYHFEDDAKLKNQGYSANLLNNIEVALVEKYGSVIIFGQMIGSFYVTNKLKNIEKDKAEVTTLIDNVCLELKDRRFI